MSASVESDQHRSVSPHPWLLVAMLTLIYTCAFVDRNVLSLLVDPIKTDLRISDVQMSLLLGIAFSVFYAMFNLPAGLLIDRYSRRILIGLSALSWSLMTIICGLAGSYWQLFLGRVGVGIAEAFITPAAFSLIRDRVPSAARGRAFGLLAVAPAVGSALALIGGGALIAAAQGGAFADWVLLSELKNWQIVLVVIGVLGLPLPLLVRFIAADQRDWPAVHDVSLLQQLHTAWQHMRQHRRPYALLIGYVTCSALLAFGYGAWLPALISRSFGMPLAQVGLTMGPIVLASSICGSLCCGMVLDRLIAARGNAIYFGMLTMASSATGMALSGFIDNVSVVWWCAALAFFFGGGAYSIGATVLSQITPAPYMGKVSAIYLLFQNVIGSGLGPTLVAMLSEHAFSGAAATAQAVTVYATLIGIVGVLSALGLHHALKANPSTLRAA